MTFLVYLEDIILLSTPKSLQVYHFNSLRSIIALYDDLANKISGSLNGVVLFKYPSWVSAIKIKPIE